MTIQYSATLTFKKWLGIATTLILFLGTDAAWAQVGSYTYSSTTGVYRQIVPEEELSQPSTDDENYNSIDLGFNFNFAGDFFSSVALSANGFLVLGGRSTYGWQDVADDNANGNIFAPRNPAPVGQIAVIGGFVADIRGRAEASLGYSQLGVAPNRQFVAQWTKFRRYQFGGENSDSLNFQIRLYEGSNKIEFIYGNIVFDPAFDRTVQVGIRGNSISDVFNLTAASWPLAIRASTPAATLAATANVFPTSGLTFSFTPIPPTPNDLGVLSIVAPRPDQTSCLLGLQETVRVVVRNYGSSPQTSAPISYSLNGGASVTKTAVFSPSPLQPGSADTVEFTGLQGANMNSIGTYIFSAKSNLAGEPAISRSNDEITGYSITLTGPINPPAVAFLTLGEAKSNNWMEGQGISQPSGNVSQWQTGFPINSETTVCHFEKTTGSRRANNEWLLSPNYNVTSTSYIVFNAAFTATLGGASPIRNIGTDTVKLLVSSDCGTTWRTLKSWSQSNLSAATINNDFRELQFQLSPSGNASIRVAFFAKTGGLGVDSAYRFQLDNIQIKELLPTDFGATSISSPVSTLAGCLLSNQETVTVEIQNFGTAPQTTCPVSYSVNNGVPKSKIFTFSPALAPGQKANVVFSGTDGANLATQGKYKLSAWTRLSGENILSTRNDSVLTSDTVVVSSPFSLPVPTIVDLATATLNGWREGRGVFAPNSSNASDWNVQFTPAGTIGITFSSSTTVDPQREWLYSPVYIATPATSFTFKAFVVAANNLGPSTNGMGDDSVSVRVSTDCGRIWRTVRRFSQANILTNTLSNTPTEFSFPITTGTENLTVGFFANNNATAAPLPYRFIIDDLKVKNAIANDLGVVAILNPVTNSALCTLSAPSILKVVVKNFGTAPQTSVPVGYRVNGGPLVSETFSRPSIARNATDTITFSPANGPNLSAPGNYTFSAFTQVQGEDSETRLNDTLKNYTFRSVAPVAVAASGLFDNFDRYPNSFFLPIGWTRETAQATEWQILGLRGVDTIIGGIASITNSLTFRALNSNRSSFFVTPRYLLSTAQGTNLQFDYRIIESRRSGTPLSLQDSTIFEVTNNCGLSWQRLWLLNARTHIQSANYRTVFFDLASYLGQEVAFRMRSFLFRTDAGGCYFDIDQFRIGQPVAISRSAAALGIVLAPNPASSSINIQFGALKASKVTIVSALGKVAASYQVAGSAGSYNIAGLAKGVYSVIVAGKDGQKASIKFVKE